MRGIRRRRQCSGRDILPMFSSTLLLVRLFLILQRCGNQEVNAQDMQG